MKHVARFAGVSTINGGDLHFHTTGMGGKIGVWMEVPGRAVYEFVKLPKAMNKLNAVKYVRRHKAFKKAKVQKFLDNQIDRREQGITVTPRKAVEARTKYTASRPNRSTPVVQRRAA